MPPETELDSLDPVQVIFRAIYNETWDQEEIKQMDAFLAYNDFRSMP